MNWDYRINKETFRIHRTLDGFYIIGMMDESLTDGGFCRFNQKSLPTFEQACTKLLEQIETYGATNWE